ncbi:MAG: hypothetical protein H6732_03040 [Alphaproteobacteria bacterium]|nr:hypothetical protein [Alphaproteobacteria bacterium]
MQGGWCWLRDAQGRLAGPVGPSPWEVGSAANARVRAPTDLAPVHVVLRGGPQGITADPRAATWLLRAGDVPTRLHGPTVARPGDGLALGAPDGWRLEVVRSPEAGRAPRRAPPAPALPQGLAAEAVRRLRMRALASAPGHAIDGAWRALRSGRLRSPVVLVGGALALGGWLVGGTQWRARVRADAVADEAAHRLAACEAGLADSAPTDLDGLAAAILGDRGLEGLTRAPALAEATQAALQRLLATPGALHPPRWRPRGSAYRRATAALEGAGSLPPALARRLAWLAVDPLEPGSLPPWQARPAMDPTAAACLRGPWALSYAQGVALGLDVREDALLSPTEAALLPALAPHARAAHLRAAWDATRHGAGLGAGATLTGIPTTAEVPWVAGGGVTRLACVADAGHDDRDSLLAVARAVGEHLGVRADGLPPGDAPGAHLVRLVALHAPAARATLGDPAAVDAAFGPGSHGAALRDAAATHLARLLAVPCAEALRPGPPPPDEVLGPPPDLDACASLAARATLGRWSSQ